jgi:hypothetical protein
MRPENPPLAGCHLRWLLGTSEHVHVRERQFSDVSPGATLLVTKATVLGAARPSAGSHGKQVRRLAALLVAALPLWAPAVFIS